MTIFYVHIIIKYAGDDEQRHVLGLYRKLIIATETLSIASSGPGTS